MAAVLKASMLGELSLTYGENRIEETQNRSRKVWMLLAYLLHHHGRAVPQNELIDVFWDDDHGGANPANALKTTLHRVRALLDLLEPGGGRNMILSKGGGYQWNREVPLWLDTAEFDRLCAADERESGEERIDRLTRAVELYRGSFLEKLSSESWMLPASAYYQGRYIRAVGELLELLEGQKEWARAEEICRRALRLEPAREDFYQHLMRVLLAAGRQGQAVEAYEEMSRLLLADYGVMPDQESRALYREALRSDNRKTVPAGIVMEQLREGDVISGALVCDYDFFKMIYRAEARMIARSGDAVHVALLCVKESKGGELARRSLELAMDHLQEQIRFNLRKGDVVARCSPSQFVVMLPQAGYENSGMVCRRILGAFSRRYPHSPAVVEYTVFPMEPVV